MNKTIVNRRKIGDYFSLYYNRKSTLYLDHFLNLFDPKDYWIYKQTNVSRLVSIEELKDFKYSGYVFYKKSVYDINHIEMWIKWINDNKLNIKFLTKPFPPFNPNKLIKLLK